MVPAFAQSKKKKNPHERKEKIEAATANATPTPGTQVPLPIGHEAKGLVLPDIDENGHLRGRFVAGVARRADQNHMEFRDLKITTFTEDNKIDMEVTMSDGSLDLNTHVLTSGQKTFIKRADFNVVGDSAKFDTAARQATLQGNVKMVITDANKLTGTKPQ